MTVLIQNIFNRKCLTHFVIKKILFWIRIRIGSGISNILDPDSVKYLDPDPDWIRIQQQPGPGPLFSKNTWIQTRLEILQCWILYRIKLIMDQQHR
jgi:hypothetical protein